MCVATYREMVAHSAYDMFSVYKCLIVILGFPPRALGLDLDSDCTSSLSLLTYLPFPC